LPAKWDFEDEIRPVNRVDNAFRKRRMGFDHFLYQIQ
jgi:hypothetical protein